MLLHKLKNAFRERKKSKKYIYDNFICDEREEIESIINKNWDELTSDILEKNFEVLNWLSPEDFCYYIAGVIYVSINENNPELLVINSIINMLDRSCNLSYWDENFSKRWTLFNNSELDVIYEWIIWLSSHKIYDEISLLRSLYCIEYIKNIINNY
ncbi:hypothetical protein [Desulfomicrobium orale]|uniref:hypothetical protein n=1 Tax=Desulfomicrobium orale TaxID=132132 RepID=UPI001244B11E|nr:hypothetical protein [Desulfomicrobium orale]